MLPLLAVLAALTAVDPPPSVRLNDNTHPAGRLESGRLTVSLMPPGQRFDSQTDHVVLVGLTHLEGQDEPLMMNGSVKPAPVVLRAGVTNRLRLINITANNVDLTFRLTNRGELADRTPRAQDGAMLPPALQRLGPARSLVTVGGTYDVELPAGAAGNRRWLEVRRSSGAWLLQAPLLFSAAPAASPVDR